MSGLHAGSVAPTGARFLSGTQLLRGFGTARPRQPRPEKPELTMLTIVSPVDNRPTAGPSGDVLDASVWAGDPSVVAARFERLKSEPKLNSSRHWDARGTAAMRGHDASPRVLHRDAALGHRWRRRRLSRAGGGGRSDLCDLPRGKTSGAFTRRIFFWRRRFEYSKRNQKIKKPSLFSSNGAPAERQSAFIFSLPVVTTARPVGHPAIPRGHKISGASPNRTGGVAAHRFSEDSEKFFSSAGCSRCRSDQASTMSAEAIPGQPIHAAPHCIANSRIKSTPPPSKNYREIQGGGGWSGNACRFGREVCKPALESKHMGAAGASA